MGIDFENLPYHLRIQACKKTVFKDYIQLQQTSRSIQETLKFVKWFPHSMQAWTVKPDSTFRMTYNIGGKTTEDLKAKQFAENCLKEPLRIKFKVFCFEGNFTDDVYHRMETLLRKHWTCKRIRLDSDVNCDPEAFNKLVLLSKAQEITSFFSTMHLDPIYLQLPAVKLMTSYLHIRSPMGNDDFTGLSFRAFRLSETHISFTGVNRFLKQWVAGEREVASDSFVEGNFIVDENSGVLQGVPHKALWNEEIWASSHLRHLSKDGVDKILGKKVFGIEAGGLKLVFQQMDDTLVWFRPVVCFKEFLGKMRNHALEKYDR